MACYADGRKGKSADNSLLAKSHAGLQGISKQRKRTDWRRGVGAQVRVIGGRMNTIPQASG